MNFGLNRSRIAKRRNSKRRLMKCSHQMDLQWHIHSNKIRLYMNNRLQVLPQIKSPLEKHTGQVHQAPRPEDQKHKSRLTGQDKQTSIRLDLFTNLVSTSHLQMALTLTLFKMVIEQQANLIEKMRIKSKPAKDWWSKSNIMLWEIILKKNKSYFLDNNWSLMLKIPWRVKRNS